MISELPARAFRKARTIYWHENQKVREFIWKKSREGRLNQARLEGLRAKFKGQRCFIIGNGPSLKKLDLKVLQNELTIGSNGIFLIREEMGFLPTFLTVEDNLVAEDRSNQLNSLSGTIKIFPHDLAYCLLPDESTIFVNFVRQYRTFPRFSENFAEIAYWGGTVTFMNLQFAYYLGCREIYLIGVDHNYKLPDPSKIVDTVITSDADDVNHIHPDYFGKGYRWHDPKVERMEESYRFAQSFLQNHGIQSYNATLGGKLEVFARKSFDDLFKGR